MILTHPKQYASIAVQVNNTWARRCNKYYFIGSQSTNTSIPLILLPLRESRQILWKKVRMAFQAVHDQEHIEDFDYFLKADDDTFVVMENLRSAWRWFPTSTIGAKRADWRASLANKEPGGGDKKREEEEEEENLRSFLSGHDPNEATIFGRRFAYQGDLRQQYMSGGAGYVLSRRALQLLVGTGFGSTRAPGVTDYCNIDYISVEDYLMGRCLKLLGVKFGHSLDEQKRERFHPLRPETMVNPRHVMSWMKQYNYHPFEKCVTCISNTSVSFHYVDDILEIEFLLYHMRV
uniref:N-acetylgalactosaminide beta-1,3-galactosyltransferase n=1 Tax=Macrostomum lignano TaxID=282301 RepID=A0A1I8FTL5_9PLAT